MTEGISRASLIAIIAVIVVLAVGWAYFLITPKTTPTPTPTTPTSTPTETPEPTRFEGYESVFHMLLKEKNGASIGNVMGELVVGGESGGRLPVTLTLSYMGKGVEGRRVERLNLEVGFAVWFWEYTTGPPPPIPVGQILWRTLSLRSGDSFTYYNSTHDIAGREKPTLVLYCTIESLQIDFADGSTWNYTRHIMPFWYSEDVEYPPSAKSVLLSDVNGKRETNTFTLYCGVRLVDR